MKLETITLNLTPQGEKRASEVFCEFARALTDNQTEKAKEYIKELSTEKGGVDNE